MIFETIISTTDKKGKVNFAPFGIKKKSNFIYISPYIPSKTLENIEATNCAVINYTNNALFFVNCILGKKEFKKKKCKYLSGFFLEDSISHDEVVVKEIQKNKIRPTFKCEIINSKNHNRFEGLNRAQFALIEACILATRINMIDNKILKKELDYLSKPIDKTGGRIEKELWLKLNKHIENEINKKK